LAPPVPDVPVPVVPIDPSPVVLPVPVVPELPVAAGVSEVSLLVLVVVFLWCFLW